MEKPSLKIGAMIGNNLGAPSVAILGLGEAGRLLARDLIAGGATVCGWDPDLRGDLSGIPIAASLNDAVRGASLVISVNWAIAALEAARDAAPQLGPGTVFADHNTAGPDLKKQLAAVVEATGASFVDVAMMAPVPGLGMRVPMFLAGSAASDLAAYYRGFGTPADVVGTVPGEAAARKLTRSVFFKGMSAAICEALDAARAAGVEAWLRADIARTFIAADAALLDRVVAGTYTHATRRAHEMREAVALLGALGVPAPVSAAAAASLERISRSQGETCLR